VLIRVAAASLNPSDYKIINDGSANFLVRKPGIPGFDFSGVVVCTLGLNQPNSNTSDTKALAPGTRVYGHLIPEWKMILGTGTLSQYIVAFPPLILPIPPSLSFEDGASVFLTGITGWQGLVENGKIKAGQRVFVNGGSGGTGVWGIQVSEHLRLGCETYSRVLDCQSPWCIRRIHLFLLFERHAETYWSRRGNTFILYPLSSIQHSTSRLVY
jgi:NADPH:quinone reductase-like Zn-dependent oxidoreductase